jgi:hypothetical protein
MDQKRKIIQMVPADGWFAQLQLKREDSEGFEMVEKRLICWALVVQSGLGTEQSIVGVIAGAKGEPSYVDQDRRFGGYIFKPRISENSNWLQSTNSPCAC